VSDPGEGIGNSGEVARGDECSSCMTGMTLLVGITGKPFLSSTTDVTSWPPSLVDDEERYCACRRRKEFLLLEDNCVTWVSQP